MYLFGSRSPECPKTPRLDSDIDVFVETDAELVQIPPNLLIVNGGPIDAFWMPSGDVACAIGDDDDRRLQCYDDLGLCVDPVHVSVEEILAMTARWPSADKGKAANQE